MLRLKTRLRDLLLRRLSSGALAKCFVGDLCDRAATSSCHRHGSMACIFSKRGRVWRVTRAYKGFRLCPGGSAYFRANNERWAEPLRFQDFRNIFAPSYCAPHYNFIMLLGIWLVWSHLSVLVMPCGTTILLPCRSSAFWL